MAAESAYGITCAAEGATHCPTKGPAQASTKRTTDTAETNCGTTYCTAKSSARSANPAGPETTEGSSA